MTVLDVSLGAFEKILDKIREDMDGAFAGREWG